MDPLYIAIPVVIVVGITARSLAAYAQRKRESAQRIRALWGIPSRRKQSEQEAALYHDLKSEGEESWVIDNRTWEDLYLPDIFRALDHTRSRVGSQVLYDLLRTPAFAVEEIERRNRLAQLFTDDVALREKMQTALEALDSEDAGLLANLFFKEIPPRPVAYLFYPFMTFCVIATGITMLFIHSLWLLLLPLLIVNIVLSQKYREMIQPWIQPLRVLNTLVRTARVLSRLTEGKNSPDLDATVAPIRENREALIGLDRVTRWLLFERNNTSDLPMILIEYLNMLLLLDVNAFVFSIEGVRSHRKLICTLFETVGTVDAVIAIASYRHSLTGFCVPDILPPKKQLLIELGLHPLLARGVPNSLKVDDRGILVTGSNMSGKTTFIRMVAVNAVLAQTIATCLAHRYQAPLLGVQSSIGRTDSLSEGKSYYMAEVETIGEFLGDSAQAAPCLFVIDEIFRGTNTTERVAASKAVLDALNRPDGPHIVLVSTHDIELSSLLQTSWDRYHFRESVQEGELHFDHMIREGLSSSRNALQLLAARDYPAAVVADAEATAARIEKSTQSRLAEPPPAPSPGSGPLRYAHSPAPDSLTAQGPPLSSRG